MMIRTRHLLCTAALCLVGGASFGADVLEVVERAQESDRHVSYRGLKNASVFGAEDPVTAIMKVVHLKPDKTRTEYFAPVMLAGVVVVQAGSDMWRYSPSGHAWEAVRHSCCQLQNGLSTDLVRNYSIRLLGLDQVAGRPAYVVYAEPRRPGEVARRLWIDREHYLVVGTQAEKPSGRVLSRSRYISIEFEPGDISPSIFVVSGKIKEPARAAAKARFKTLKPAYVPRGYRLVGEDHITVQDTTCSHLQFANGADTISLFQRKADSRSAEPKIDGKLLNVFSWTYQGMRLTLVGSVPDAELRKMAESVR